MRGIGPPFCFHVIPTYLWHPTYRVLSYSIKCMGGIGPPFCFHVIPTYLWHPTYRVLSHSMLRLKDLMVIVIVVYFKVCGHANKQTVVLILQTVSGDTTLKLSLGHNQNNHLW